MLSLLLLAGCGGKQEKPSPPAIGVADLAALMQAHPLYESYAKKKQVLEGKRWAAEAVGSLPAVVVDVTPSLPALVAGSGEGEAKRSLLVADWQRKVEEKRSQLMKELVRELKTYQDELDKEAEPRLFNLKLRANTIALTTEEAAANEQAVNMLQQERANKIRAHEQMLRSKMADELSAMHRQAMQEIDVSYQQEAGERMIVLPPIPEMAVEEKSSPALQEVNALEKEVSDLENRMRREIETATAKAAEKQNITVVFNQSFIGVNVSALDMTDSIIAEMAKQ